MGKPLELRNKPRTIAALACVTRGDDQRSALPSLSTMTDWATKVDRFLKAKTELDRLKAQRAKQATGGQGR